MIASCPEGVVISLHVIPGAPKNEIVGEHNGCLKIKINAPPVDGKANAAIESFLAEALTTSKRNVQVLKGEKSKAKKILVTGLSIEQVKSLLSLKLKKPK